MKNKYTRKQIMESIKYWKKRLNEMNEDGDGAILGKYLYVTKNNPSFNGMVRKAGISGLNKPEDPYRNETIATKLDRYSTCTPIKWQAAYVIPVIVLGYQELKTLEDELFAYIKKFGGKRNTLGGGTELFAIDDASLEKAIDAFVNDHPDDVRKDFVKKF